MSRPSTIRRLPKAIAAALALVSAVATVVVGAASPAHADLVDDVLGLGNFIPPVSTYLAYVKTGYDAYARWIGGQSAGANAAVIAAINTARTQIIAEIDGIAAADVAACANNTVNTFQNIDQLSQDNLQSFAVDSAACAILTQQYINALTDKAAVDKAGFALSTVGPVALLVNAEAGFNTTTLRQAIIDGNTRLIAKLEPTCLIAVTSVLLNDTDGGPITGQGKCFAYSVPVPAPRYDSPNIYLGVGSGPGIGTLPWTVAGLEVPDTFLIFTTGDHASWPAIDDWQIAANQAMAQTSYVVAQRALSALRTAMVANGSPVAVVRSTQAGSGVQAIRTNGSADTTYTHQAVAGYDDWAWSQLGGVLQNVSAVSNSDGRIELFGIDAVGAGYHRWQIAPGDEGAWSDWTPMPGGPYTSLTAARNADGTVELVCTVPGGSVFTRRQRLGFDANPVPANPVPGVDAWTGWQQIGDLSMRQVVAATNQNGTIELIGLDPSGNVRHSTQVAANPTDPVDSHNWTPWAPLPLGDPSGQRQVTSIAVAGDAGHPVQLFGVDSSDRVWQTQQAVLSNTLWANWTQIGSGIHSIGAAFNAAGLIDVYGLDAAGNVLYNQGGGPFNNTWGAWRSATGHVVPQVGQGPLNIGQLPDFSTQLGVPQPAQLSASGGFLPYTWSVTGLPPGLSFTPGGQISGAPTALGQFAGSYTLSDGVGHGGTRFFVWTVTANEVRVFTGTGHGSSPGQASAQAVSNAKAKITAAGFRFVNCTEVQDDLSQDRVRAVDRRDRVLVYQMNTEQ